MPGSSGGGGRANSAGNGLIRPRRASLWISEFREVLYKPERRASGTALMARKDSLQFPQGLGFLSICWAKVPCWSGWATRFSVPQHAGLEVYSGSPEVVSSNEALALLGDAASREVARDQDLSFPQSLQLRRLPHETTSGAYLMDLDSNLVWKTGFSGIDSHLGPFWNGIDHWISLLQALLGEARRGAAIASEQERIISGQWKRGSLNLSRGPVASSSGNGL